VNINYLRTFLTVLETGSFSAAARMLSITQPAVSMQIQALEDYFGTKLLERRGRGLELTRAGELALRNVSHLLELIDSTRKEIDEMASEVAGPLLLGASTVPGEHLCPTLLGIFMQRYPRVKPRLLIENTAVIVAKLERHEIDLAIVGAAPKEAEIRAEPIFQDEIVLLVPPKHRFASLEQVPLEEFCREPLITRSAGSGSRLFVERELAQRGINMGRLGVVLEVGTSLAALNAVEAGIGVALVSAFAAEKSVRLGVVAKKRVQGLSFNRSLYLLTLHRRYGGRSIAEMATFLRSPEARRAIEGRVGTWEK